MVERFGRHRNDVGGIEPAETRCPTPTEYEANAELLRHLEDHVRGIEAIILGEHVMVIGGRGGAREQELDEPDARCDAKRLLVDLVPVGMRHDAQPLEQRAVDARTHALEHALEKVVMGRYQPGIDHAAGCVDALLARQRIKLANPGNAPLHNSNGALRAHRRTGKASENSGGARDQDGGHDSAPEGFGNRNTGTSSSRQAISHNRTVTNSAVSLRSHHRSEDGHRDDCG